MKKGAKYLNAAGLFRGTAVEEDGTPHFDLDKPATRMQGLVMLIRLLGEEEAALSYTGKCPFKDLSGQYAQYAAYAYSKGYTTGVSKNTFGEGPLTANAFITFTLRALGYDDRNGDFKYSEAYKMAENIGMIQKGAYADQKKAFLRDDCAYVSFRALDMIMKNENTYLIESLAEKGVVEVDMISIYMAICETFPELGTPKKVLSQESQKILDEFIKSVEKRNGKSYERIVKTGPEIYDRWTQKMMWDGIEVLKNDPCSQSMVDFAFGDFEKGFMSKADVIDALECFLIWYDVPVDMWGGA